MFWSLNLEIQEVRDGSVLTGKQFLEEMVERKYTYFSVHKLNNMLH